MKCLGGMFFEESARIIVWNDNFLGTLVDFRLKSIN